MNLTKHKSKLINAIGIKPDIADWLIAFDQKFSLYFAKQLQNVNITIGQLEEYKASFRNVIDWVIGSSLRGKHIQLKQYELADAIQAAHDWHKDIEAEAQGEITIEDNGKVIMQFPNGYYWIDLEKHKCLQEAKAMQHCGTASQDNTLLSLRKNKKPYITAEASTDYSKCRQMKGKQNTKPLKKYHPYILELIRRYDCKVSGFSHSNFELLDLSVEQLTDLCSTNPKIKQDIIANAVSENWSYDKTKEIVPDINKHEYQLNVLKQLWDVKSATYNEDTDTYDIYVANVSGRIKTFLKDLNVNHLDYASSYESTWIYTPVKCNRLTFHGDIIVDSNHMLPAIVNCKSIEFNVSRNNGIQELMGDLEIICKNSFDGEGMKVHGRVHHNIERSAITNVEANIFTPGINFMAYCRKHNLINREATMRNDDIYSKTMTITSGLKALASNTDGTFKYNIISESVHIRTDFSEFDKIKADTINISLHWSAHKRPTLNIDFTNCVCKDLGVHCNINDNDTLQYAETKRLIIDNNSTYKKLPRIVNNVSIFDAPIIKDASCPAKYWNFSRYGRKILPPNMPNDIISITIDSGMRIAILESLKGCPQNVKRNFYCTNISLKSLKGMPKTVGKNVNVKNALAEGFTAVSDVNALCKVGANIKADIQNHGKKSEMLSKDQEKQLLKLGLTPIVTKTLTNNKTIKYEDHTTNRFYTMNARTGNVYWQYIGGNGQNRTLDKCVYDINLQFGTIIKAIEKHRKDEE